MEFQFRSKNQLPRQKHRSTLCKPPQYAPEGMVIYHRLALLAAIFQSLKQKEKRLEHKAVKVNPILDNNKSNKYLRAPLNFIGFQSLITKSSKYK